jgi:hypothetical protein
MNLETNNQQNTLRNCMRFLNYMRRRILQKLVNCFSKTPNLELEEQIIQFLFKQRKYTKIFKIIHDNNDLNRIAVNYLAPLHNLPEIVKLVHGNNELNAAIFKYLAPYRNIENLIQLIHSNNELNEDILKSLLQYDKISGHENMSMVFGSIGSQLKNALMLLQQNGLSEDNEKIALDSSFHYLHDINSNLDQTQGSDVTIIYPFRDRNVERLVLSYNSLKYHSTIPFNTIVVDYGSAAQYKKELMEVCKKNQIRYVRIQAEGLPWSRGAALNAGIKAATTKYIVTTDIDMLFESDALAISKLRYQPNTVLHCRPMWLTESGIREEAFFGSDYYQLGGFQFIERDCLQKVGLFNSSIEYWGLEDIELAVRLKKNSVQSIWIDDELTIYHIWHPFSYGAGDPRPPSSWINSTEAVFRASADLKKKRSISQDAIDRGRPIINKMEKDEPMNFELSSSYHEEFEDLLSYSIEHKFISIDLGKNISTPTEQLKGYIRKVNETIGNDVKLDFIKNNNFNNFYLSLPILAEKGLIDYFIYPNNEVLLLFE